MTRLLGIYREPECSPGRHRSNDALLLESIAARLRTHGVRVDLATLDSVRPARPDAALVLSMCQGREGLEMLSGWEREGVHIVNSPCAARNTYRDRLPAILRTAGVPFPRTTIVGIADERFTADLSSGMWLKRGDVHASVSADVQWVDSAEHLRAGLQDFRSRGIHHAALQEHRAGTEIKFYGIAGGAFFHWFFTDGARQAAPDAAALQALGERAAGAARLDIFGGDVIVEPSGALTLIDLNDWPSFAPCREAAAQAIATHVMRRVKHAVWNPGLVPSANESAV